MKLDFWTAVVTAFTTILLMPLIVRVFKLLGQHARSWLDVAVDGSLYWVSRFILHSLAARVSLKAYCRLLLASTRHVPVPSTRDINLDLDAIFVTLNLESSGSGPRVATHADILRTGNRLRLIGDPGSGKSCLTKRLLRDAAAAALKRPSAARLPILLELRNVRFPETADDDLGAWLYNELREKAATANVHKMRDCFDTFASSAGLLILLDGLDEVSSRSYISAQTAINQLAQRLAAVGENNIVVVTSRTQFHQQVRDAYAEQFPTVFYLKPFTPTDIYEFLARWPFGNDAMGRINKIYRDLTDRPTLRELCGNPLILSMYVAEADGPDDQLVPDSRTEFYSRVVEELLVNRRARQFSQFAGRAALRDFREQILSGIAYDHLLDDSQPANSLDWASAIAAIQRKLEVDSATAEIVFNELGRETGLFTAERPGETFRFMHLTFCEFFAALAAVKHRHDGWQELVGTQRRLLETGAASARTRLLEVIPFACGLLHPVRRSDAITDVAALGDRRLLARCFLETKLYTHGAWMTLATEQRRSLLVAPAQWDEEWLFDFHLFNVAVRDAALVESTGVRIAYHVNLDTFLHEVVALHENGLAQLIDRYAERDAAAVFRVSEVAGIDLIERFPSVVVDNLDQRPFMALVLERLPAGGDKVEHWATLLCEAALRSRAVATELAGRQVVAGWECVVTDAVLRGCWSTRGILKPSLHAQCMTIAANSRRPGSELLELLRQIPSPGKYRLLLSPVSVIAFPILAMVAAMLVGPAVVSAGHDRWMWFGVLYLAASPGYFMMRMRMRTRAIFAELLGGGLGTTMPIGYALGASLIARLTTPPQLRAAAMRLIAARASAGMSDDVATGTSIRGGV